MKNGYEVPNPEGMNWKNMWNITTFDPVVTNKIQCIFAMDENPCVY